MISGKYLGEIVRLALKDLISREALFGGKSSAKFDKAEAFSTNKLSVIERGYVMSNLVGSSRTQTLHVMGRKRLIPKVFDLTSSVVVCIHVIDTFPDSIRDIGDCKKMFKKDFSIEASDQDCEVVRRMCEAVSTRAARLAAAGIVALVKKIKKIGGCTVAVDGSLYRRHPKFPERYYHYVILESITSILFLR